MSGQFGPGLKRPIGDLAAQGVGHLLVRRAGVIRIEFVHADQGICPVDLVNYAKAWIARLTTLSISSNVSRVARLSGATQNTKNPGRLAWQLCYRIRDQSSQTKFII